MALALAIPAAYADAPGTTLSGTAYQLADEANRAYARGDFDEAIAKARQAQRLRPDAEELRVLLRKARAGRTVARSARDESGAQPGPAARAEAPARSVRVSRGRSGSGLGGQPRDLAFVAADAGYKSYARGDYPMAVEHAQQAVRLAPGNRDYRLLLVNALSAANRLTEAERAVALSDERLGEDPRLTAQRQEIRRRMATAPAAAAFAALERRDAPGAIDNARNAVALAPDNQIYRMTLIYALLQGGRFEEAEREASAGMALNPADPSPQVLRAYARQRLGRRAEAVADLDAGLQRPGLSPAAQRSLRLIASDAALAANEPQRALELLQSAPQASGDDFSSRMRAVRQAQARGAQGGPSGIDFPLPGIDCSQSSAAQACALIPGSRTDPAYAAGAAAYQAFSERNYAVAATGAREAVLLDPDNRDYRLLLLNSLLLAGQDAEAEAAATAALAGQPDDGPLLAQRGSIRKRLGKTDLAREDFEAALRAGKLPVVTEIGVLADLERMPEARQRFAEAQAGGGFAGVSDVDIGYLAARLGDDTAALAAFERANAAGKLPNTAYQDAAYSAIRAGEDAQAIGYLKRSIDDVNALKLRMEPRLLFDTRRAVSEVSRQWGVIASATYGSAVSGIGFAPGVGTKTGQVGVEAYWRPWGFMSGRYVELFARGFQTFYSKGGGTTGGDTTSGGVGIRYKPFTNANLVASLSRVFYAASGSDDDWLAQVAYSNDTGTDLRVDVPAWWTVRASAEIGRYLSNDQNYALARVEAGRSFRQGDSSGRWVLFPHVVIAADYDSFGAERGSFGAGPGVSARYWFREDVYHAPRSYVDLTLSYRLRLAGAERAKGVFFTSTLSY